MLYAAENHQGNPNAGVAYELDAIAAVVIGGTRLSGGKGSISGTIVGTLIMGVLTNMLRLNNVDSNVEMMIKAVIIVLAVAVQQRDGHGLTDLMTRRFLHYHWSTRPAALLLGVGCGGGSQPSKKQFFVAFSQANNAEPYRAAQNALMTKLFGAAARRQAGDLRRAAGQQQAGGAGGDLHPAEAGPADRGAQRARRADRRDGPGDGGEDPGDLPGARHPAAELHHLRAQRQRRHRPPGRPVHRRSADAKSTASRRATWWRCAACWAWKARSIATAARKEIFDKYPEIKIVADPVADWIQAKAKDRMTEVLRAQPKIDVVYGHNDPMAIGAYLAAKELGREKEMIFVGVDGLGGPAGGIKKVMDGVLAATFVYPLCVDKAVEIALKMLREPGFKPEKEYSLRPSW